MGRLKLSFQTTLSGPSDALTDLGTRMSPEIAIIKGPARGTLDARWLERITRVEVRSAGGVFRRRFYGDG